MELNIYKTLSDILSNEDDQLQKKLKLVRLFQVVLDQALEHEEIHFTSLFSKVAYFGVRFQLPSILMYELHQLRKRIENPDRSQVDEDIHLLSYLIAVLQQKITKEAIPKYLQSKVPISSGLVRKSPEIKNYLPQTKLFCIEIDKDQKRLIGFTDENDEKRVKVVYDIPDRNERFTQNLDALASKLPLLMELIEIEVDHNAVHRPSAFVIEPDFLIDVTSIASCFDHAGTKLIGYIFRKFLPTPWSKPLLLGNIANYFLDRIVDDPKITFDSILSDVFQLDPLGFAQVNNSEMPSLLADMKMHFVNIKNSIQNEFPKEHIDPDSSYLEPSFISAQYGIQGRLDLLHMDENFTTIVELKSGSIYRPNVYGLKNDHYVQTLLYDLLIRSIFPENKPRNYILYSKESKKSLRLAPRIAAQQKEALQVRNQLLSIEHKLTDRNETRNLLQSINTNLYADAKGFEARNIARFERAYSRLDEIEKAYFDRFVNFIALEHRLSKIGEYGQDKNNGLAGIWLDSYEEKTEQFNMITHLEIIENKSSEQDASIRLGFTDKTNQLSNFRTGDIIILYPLGHGVQSALKNQIFKCTILEMQSNSVLIRLRSQQKNQMIFDTNALWAIEHDMMDNSFHNMYRQLFEWAEAPVEKRSRLLSLTPPANLNDSSFKDYPSLTNEQNQILKEMVNTQDYYLVWGPPGTGKTSRMIAHYIKYVMEETDENLYVLAYTNRAVDELCESIESLGDSYSDKYIRIGSRYGTDERFRSRLLQNKIQDITRRKALRQTIQSHRLVVGTMASIASKDIIFKLIPAKRIIIDEASQILEPNIVGLLTRFEKFILVGDHQQLPAVVVQNKKASESNIDILSEVGLIDCRDSLFERLYRQCQKNNWKHAWGQLQHQGRMHQKIMNFPNVNFYSKRLKTLNGLDRLTASLDFQENSTILSNERLIFWQVGVPEKERFSKTNSAEVGAITEAVKAYEEQGFPLEEIGIITPFRAQIAAIKDALLKISNQYNQITVDTVERFQGGARRVILISFCCNSPIQLRTLISLSSKGIDRKLNVALTRARERLLLVGDERILRLNPLYSELLDACVKYQEE